MNSIRPHHPPFLNEIKTPRTGCLVDQHIRFRHIERQLQPLHSILPFCLSLQAQRIALSNLGLGIGRAREDSRHTQGLFWIFFGGSKGGILLASCSSDLTIKLWDPSNDYANIRTLPEHEHSVSAVRFCRPPREIFWSPLVEINPFANGCLDRVLRENNSGT